MLCMDCIYAIRRDFEIVRKDFYSFWYICWCSESGEQLFIFLCSVSQQLEPRYRSGWTDAPTDIKLLWCLVSTSWSYSQKMLGASFAVKMEFHPMVRPAGSFREGEGEKNCGIIWECCLTNSFLLQICDTGCAFQSYILMFLSLAYELIPLDNLMELSSQ